MVAKPFPIRIDEAMIARLDRIVATMTGRASGVPVSRANVIRAVLDRGAESFERELGIKRPKRK